ncbi:phage virion morphogenesis protein [Limnovirga soli]|nr:phage virion morphogenesis protein [Limnovirga soli]
MSTLPYKVGVLMVAYSKDRFKYQNWIDTYPEPWKPRSRKKPWKKKGKSPNNSGRAILVKSGRLRRSIRIVNTTSNSVTIGSDVPYAMAHNDGFRGPVTQQVRQFTRINPKRNTTGIVYRKEGKKSTRIRFGQTSSGISIVKAHTRTINQNMPRRRFMGQSMYLNKQINRLIAAEINKIFK